MSQTTWAYRFWCPECGYESVTQKESLRDAMLDWHEDDAHGGAPVCEWEYDDEVRYEEFPSDEDPDVEQASVTTTPRALEVTGDD